MAIRHHQPCDSVRRRYCAFDSELNSAISILEKSKKQAQLKMQKEALQKFNLSYTMDLDDNMFPAMAE